MVVKVLDLFSGTGSVAKICEKEGYECVSLDMNSVYHEPDIKMNILKWDYKKAYAPGHFDIVFAGVPCTEYSILNHANNNKIPDIKGSNKVVRRTLQIIDYFKPKVWFIENPESGSLKDQSFMKDLPYYRVSFCMYGFQYQKRTRIWTNLKNFKPKYCRFDCKNIVDGKHSQVLGDRTTDTRKNISNLKQKYSYPLKLIEALFKQALK